MKIDAAVMENVIADAERFHTAAIIPADCGRINVESEIARLRARLKAEIDEHLQPWFVLLDESVQFFVQFERYLYERPLSSHLTAYAVTVSKLKRDVIYPFASSWRSARTWAHGCWREPLSKTSKSLWRLR